MARLIRSLELWGGVCCTATAGVCANQRKQLKQAPAVATTAVNNYGCAHNYSHTHDMTEGTARVRNNENNIHSILHAYIP